MPEYLLISDIDNTMLGDDNALAITGQWLHKEGDRIRLAYATGRFFAPVQHLVRTTPLPAPTAVIGGVGTDIHWFAEADRWDAWPGKYAKKWNTETVSSVLADFDRAEPQPPEHHSPYKVSFYFNNATADDLDAIRKALDAAGVEADIIYSSQRDLDVLPRNINKGTAAVFLAEHWGVPRERVIVSGDSGNDLALFQHGFRGVVVGNAHEELKSLKSDSVYHAEQSYAAGVLEGWKHWMGLA